MKGKPINIDPDLAARCDGEGQFGRFDDAFKAVLKQPHESKPKTKPKKKAKKNK
jgi:hypothetical protein